MTTYATPRKKNKKKTNQNGNVNPPPIQYVNEQPPGVTMLPSPTRYFNCRSLTFTARCRKPCTKEEAFDRHWDCCILVDRRDR